jgi:hypothetical protein
MMKVSIPFTVSIPLSEDEQMHGLRLYSSSEESASSGWWNGVLSKASPSRRMPQVASTAAAVTMFNQVIESVKVGLSAGIHDVFLMTMVIIVVGTIAIFFLKEIPLRGGRQRASETPAEETPEAESKLTARI